MKFDQHKREFMGELGEKLSIVNVASRATLLFLAGFLIAGSISWFFYNLEEKNQQTQLVIKAQQQIATQKAIISQELKNLSTQVHYLAHQSVAHGDISRPENIHDLIEDFISLMKSTDYVDQLRILDLSGKEIIRVNHNQGNPDSVSADKLQDKSQRDYFKEMSVMEKDSFYLSKLNLNVEQGKIELPYKPTIRIGMPVFSGNEKIGYILMNYLAKGMLDQFKAAAAQFPLELMMVDSSGLILAANDTELEWNKHLAETSQYSLKMNGKSLWPSLLASDEETFSFGNNIYIHGNINPMLEVPSTIAVSSNSQADYFWKILSYVDDAKVNAATLPFHKLIFNWLLIISLGLLLIAFALSFLIERRNIYHHQAEILRRAVSSAGEAIIITDPKSTIQFINPKFSKITGYQPNEAIGKKVVGLLKSNVQSDEFYRNLWKNISTGKQWSSFLIDRKKDGTLFPVIVTITPIFNVKQQITHYVAIYRDATEQQLLQEHAAQDAKMKTLSVVIGGIAHEFNNILAALVGNTYILKKHANPETLTRLETMENLGNKAAGMIRQMLAYIGHGDIVKIQGDIQEFSKSSVEHAHNLNQQCSANISNRPLTEPLNMEANLIQLQKAIDNLMSNACDAVKEVESPNIDVSWTTVSRTSDNEEPCTFLCIKIQDNGHGIKEEHKSMLFEPFFTTKEPNQGTGLGLSQTYGIIQKHQGFIEVESKLNEGATFSVFLPIQKGTAS